MGRGRPRCRRRVESLPAVSYFKPRGIPLTDLELVVLTVEGLECVRLVDLDGLEQERAANKMGVSRRVFWDDLQKARKGIADALVHGKAIQIKGGHFVQELKREFRCRDCGHEWEASPGAGRPDKCPECGSEKLHRNPPSRGCEGLRPGNRGRCFQTRRGARLERTGDSIDDKEGMG